MADDKNTPFSVRMDADDKAKLMKMIEESGADSNKEFMNTLISAYELNKVKVEVPEASESIKKVEELTQLINDCFVNMSKHIKITKESMNLQFTKDIDIYKDKVETLKDENSKLEDKFENLQIAYRNSCNDIEELKKELESKDKLVERLKENLEDKNALVDQYKEKNDTLTGLLNEYKAAKEENEDLKNRLDKSNLTNIQVNNDNIAKNNEIKGLKESVQNLSLNIKELKEQNSEEKEALKSLHKDEITKAIEDTMRAKESEKREALLKIKEDHQEKVGSIHNEYAARINEYQEKYRDLLKELEHIKASSIDTNNK